LIWRGLWIGIAAVAGLEGGGRGLGGRPGRLVRLGGAGFEFLERREGAVEGALDGVDAALEAVKGVAVALVGLGCLETLLLPDKAGDVELEELRFDGAEAALHPLGGDQGIDQGAHFGSSGPVAVMILGGESGESRGVFAGDDLGLSVDAGLEGIEADCGLALSGAWTSRFLRVEPVGLDLL